MTRKDYINLAAAIRATQERIEADMTGSAYADAGTRKQQQLRGVRRTAAHIADHLKQDNPRHFDVSMFLTNCGYGVGPFVTKAADSEAAAEHRAAVDRFTDIRG